MHQEQNVEFLWIPKVIIFHFEINGKVDLVQLNYVILVLRKHEYLLVQVRLHINSEIKKDK